MLVNVILVPDPPVPNALALSDPFKVVVERRRSKKAR